jgi:hypothetical protein
MINFDFNLGEELEKAENGDLEAMLNVGIYIMWGDMSSALEPEMADRAIRYYLANAEAGNSGAMLDLGAFYLEGRGVEKNTKKALEWYQKALDAGEKVAYRCLGNYWLYDHLDDGSPVMTRDEERLHKAYGYFAEGAAHHEENSMFELANFYRRGICVEKDDAKAFELYSKAYEEITKYGSEEDWIYNDSYADVCLYLAQCYHYGIGTEVNLSLARKFIEIAKRERKRMYDDGDMCGGAGLKCAEKEWQLIMQETGF